MGLGGWGGGMGLGRLGWGMGGGGAGGWEDWRMKALTWASV